MHLLFTLILLLAAVYFFAGVLRMLASLIGGLVSLSVGTLVFMVGLGFASCASQQRVTRDGDSASSWVTGSTSIRTAPSADLDGQEAAENHASPAAQATDFQSALEETTSHPTPGEASEARQACEAVKSRSADNSTPVPDQDPPAAQPASSQAPDSTPLDPGLR